MAAVRKRGGKGSLVAGAATLVYACPTGKRATIVSARVATIAAGSSLMYVGGSTDTDGVSYSYNANPTGAGTPVSCDLAVLAGSRYDSASAAGNQIIAGGPITLEATHTLYLKATVTAGYLLTVMEEDA
jgi:hypothetical protein